MGYFEFRDKVCEACNSRHFRTINEKTEKVCYHFGIKIAEYAPCLLSFFVVLYAALALGIFSAGYNSDLYYQWIEVGSRLIEERQFIQDYHSFSLSRAEYIIATGQGSSSEMMTVPRQDDIFALIQSAIQVNVTDPKDPDFPELGWFDICSRVPSPPQLMGPMRFFSGKGLPCTMYTGTDCFQQGVFNYDVPEQLRGVVAYKYPDEPDYTKMTTPGFVIRGPTNSQFGFSVALAKNFRGTGDTLIVGAPSAQGQTAGAVYIINPGYRPTGVEFDTVGWNGTFGCTISGPPGFGYAITVLDFNNDTKMDIAVSSTSQTGSVYVIFGTGTLCNPSFTLADLDGTNGFVITNAAQATWTMGKSLGSGYVNNDQFVDLLVGGDGMVLAFAGAASAPASLPVGNAIATFDGQTANTGIGAENSITSLDSTHNIDFNRDNVPDFVLLGPGVERVYVIYGKSNPGSLTLNTGSLTTHGVSLIANSSTIASVTTADIVGDTNADLVVGDSTLNGDLYIFDGQNNATNGMNLASYPSLGCSALANVNGDLICNAKLAQAVVKIQKTTLATMTTGSSYQPSALSPSRGDFDVDSFQDLVVGFPTESNRGAVYLFWGNIVFPPNFADIGANEMWLKIAGYYDGSKEGRSCTNWAGAAVPENFMYGSVSRRFNPYDNETQITGVKSIQMVLLVKTETQLAQYKCVEKCVDADKCLINMQNCAQNCVNDAIATIGPLCGANISSIPVLNDTLSGAFMTFCVYGSPSSCPLSPTALCGACYTEPDPIHPVSAACQGCQAALLSATTLPIFGSALYDYMQACLGPPAQACVQNTCFAQGSACEFNCTESCLFPPQNEIDAAQVVLENWEENYLNFMSGIQNIYPFKISYWAERTTDDLVNEAGQADAKLIVAGYFAMIAFGCITLLRFDGLQSRLLLGFGGMILVILSIVGAMGFSAMIGITFVPTIVQVLPFLALGMGTYDMFILAFAFQFLPGESVPSMIGELMKECGPRLMLTALTNIIVFGIGINIPLRAVNLFSAAMCIVILFNFLILIMAFTSLISLHAERIHRDKIDCLCCLPAPNKHTQISTHADDHTGAGPLMFSRIVFLWPVKILCIMGCIVIFGVAMWGATNIQIGLPLSDIVPKDSAAYGFLSAREKSYGSFPSYLFIRTGVNMTDPRVLGELLHLEEELQKVPGMDPSSPINSTSWLDKFFWWCHDNWNSTINPPCAQLNPGPEYPNRTIQRLGDDGLVESTNIFWPDMSEFYTQLNIYFTTNADGPYYQQYVNLASDGTIVTSRITMIQRGLDTDGQIVDFIKATRAVSDPSFVPCFPGGFLYDLYEQYVNVQQELSSNLGFTAIGVLGISFFFLLHPAAVFINVCMISLTLAECYGFLALFHLKLNGVSVVNLVLAIGLIVVPTEHITRVFMVTNGTTTDRARTALAKMVFPMLFSTISTFLGELPMEFAKFPYFRLYFFYQYVIIGLLTLCNSFLALPFFLEYFGPPSITGPRYQKGSSRSSHTHDPINIEMPALEDTRPDADD